MAGYNDEKIKEIEKIFNELEEPEFEIMAEAFPCIKKVTNKPGSSVVVVDVSSLAGLEAGSSLEKFIYGNIQALTQFVMCGSFEESQKCLLENPVLISDAAIDSMIIWCIDIKKISGSLGIIPHQIICLQCILKINQKINQDPRDGVLIFYEEIETNEEKYRDLVEKFLPALKKRVQLRVMEKYLDLKKSAEEIKYNVLEYVRQREYEKLQ